MIGGKTVGADGRCRNHTKSESLGSIAVTLRQQAKPLDRMAGLVYLSPCLELVF